MMIRKPGFLAKRIEIYVNVKGCIVCVDGVRSLTPGITENLTAKNTMGTLLTNIELERIKLDNEVLPAAMISSILAIVLLWLVSIVFGAVLASFDERLNFVAALTAHASMVGNCGPALTLVDPAAATDAILHGSTAATLAGTPQIGPMGGYAELRDWTKVVFTFQMVLGRLELLTLLALFTPSFWRR